MLRFVVVVLIFFVVSPALAQNEARIDADSVRVLYQALEYDAAERLAIAAIEADAPRPAAELAELHFLLGLVRYIRSDTLAATRDFEAVLTLQPGYGPDPVLVPPRALAFFDRVRNNLQEARPDDMPGIRYVMVADLRPAAALRSSVLPGWGQWYRGDRVRGGILSGAWLVTTGTALGLHLAEAGDGARPVQTIAMGAAGFVWLYAYLDALLTPAFSSEDGLRIVPIATPDAAGLHLSVRF